MIYLFPIECIRSVSFSNHSDFVFEFKAKPSNKKHATRNKYESDNEEDESESTEDSSEEESSSEESEDTGRSKNVKKPVVTKRKAVTEPQKPNKSSNIDLLLELDNCKRFESSCFMNQAYRCKHRTQ